jgi:hypothetical protein
LLTKLNLIPGSSRVCIVSLAASVGLTKHVHSVIRYGLFIR